MLQRTLPDGFIAPCLNIAAIIKVSRLSYAILPGNLCSQLSYCQAETFRFRAGWRAQMWEASYARSKGAASYRRILVTEGVKRQRLELAL
jgi:hypothetical protein